MPRCAYPHIIKSTGQKCKKNAITDCLYCSQHNDKMTEIPPFKTEIDTDEDISLEVQEDMSNAIIFELQNENKTLQNENNNLQKMIHDLTNRIQVLSITKPNIDKNCMYRAKLIFYHENKNDQRIIDFFKPIITTYGKPPWQFVMKLLKPEFEKLSNDEKNVYYMKAQEYIRNKNGSSI